MTADWVRLCRLPLLLLASCGPAWTPLTERHERVALSVWGPPSAKTADEAFVVGGGLGNGSPSLFLRLRSGRWETLETGGTETLWWVFGFGPDDVYAVGERGAIYRYDDKAVMRMESGTTATLFGIWGASPDDVWAVGGSPLGGGPNDVLLHFDGERWTQVEPPERLGVTYLKVWGTAKDDVFVVGREGVVLHFDGERWRRQETPTTAPLLTVHGRARDEVYAVGGPPTAMLRYDGQAWVKEPPVELASGLGGVAFGANGDLFVVGLGGAKWRRTGGKWTSDSSAPPRGDLHAVWVAPDGSALAVGGNYLVVEPEVPRRGIVAYYGTRPPPELR